MTCRERTNTNERRGPLSTAIALEHHAIPVSEATPAKLLADPKLTVQLSERELDAVRKKARKTSKNARSTS
jgi:hypothetical protein